MSAKLLSKDFLLSRRVFPVLVIALCGLAGYALIAQQRWLMLAAAATLAILTAGWPSYLILLWLPLAVMKEPGLGLGIPLSGLIIGLVAGSWGLALLVKRCRLEPVHILLGGLVLWLLFSFFLHGAAQPQILSLGTERANLIFLILGLVLVGVAASIRIPLPSLLTATCVYALVGAVVTLTTWKPGLRAAALGLNPNYLGLALAVGVVALLGKVVSLKRPIWIPALTVAAAALIRTGSRGALVAAAIGGLTVLLAGRPRRTQILILSTALCSALVFPMDPSRTSLLENRSDVELADNTRVRREAAFVALGYVVSHPVTGLGYGNFPPYALRESRLGIYINTHNDYLRLASETGLPGLALFLGLFYPIVRRRKPLDRDQRVAIALVATYAAGLLFGNTLSNLQVTAPFWLILGSFWHHTHQQTTHRETCDVR